MPVPINPEAIPITTLIATAIRIVLPSDFDLVVPAGSKLKSFPSL